MNLNKAFTYKSFFIPRFDCIKLMMLIFMVSMFRDTASAQFYSKRYLSYGSTNGYISSIQISKDTIYAMRYFVDSSNPGYFIAGLSRFNKEGDLISTMPFSLPGRTNIGANFNTLIKTNDGGFAYGGWTANGGVSLIYILKYDSYGSFQWYKEIPDSNYSTFYCTGFAQDSFSNYYLTGSFEYLSNIRPDIYLAKTDSSGNLIYKREYQYSLDSHSSSLCINKRGNIIIGSDAFDGNNNDFTGAKDYLQIYELDTAGNQITHYLGTDTNAPQADNFINTEDGGYMIASSYYCYRDRITLKWHGSISKLDSNFHKVWEVDLGPCSQYTSFFAQAKCPDGNYIAVGNWDDESDTIFDHRSGWVIKYSEDGRVIWNKRYSGSMGHSLDADENRLLSIGFFADSTIICAGQSLNFDDATVPQRGWLLHLDTLGCLPDSNSCGIVDGVEEIKSKAGIIKLYPNPASNIMTLEYSVSDAESSQQVMVINQLGQKMYEESLSGSSGSKQIDVKSWPSGLYHYRVVSGGFSQSGSFIVSH